MRYSHPNWTLQKRTTRKRKRYASGQQLIRKPFTTNRRRSRRWSRQDDQLIGPCEIIRRHGVWVMLKRVGRVVTECHWMYRRFIRRVVCRSTTTWPCLKDDWFLTARDKVSVPFSEVALLVEIYLESCKSP